MAMGEGSEQYWYSMFTYYSMQSKEQFLQYFFPDNIDAKIDETNFQYVVHGPQLSDTDLQKDKFHIMLCVENCPKHPHYIHYNKHGNYGNSQISLYFYNHIDRIEESSSYIAIPVIYSQMNYFRNKYNFIQPAQYVPFEDKKFCILLTGNGYRQAEKNKITSFVSSFGHCDTLAVHRPGIQTVSCYHSVELLNVIQQYKFAIVCENSLMDGYVTEKIFNCFFARCIPIYNGSNKIESYFNGESFLNMNDTENLSTYADAMRTLSTNKAEFQKKIEAGKIHSGYSDEHYDMRLKTFLQRLEKN